MKRAAAWLRRRADNVAVGLLTAMFVSFLVQIISRYVFNYPLGWTLEVCLTCWLWVVFWSSAFTLDDREHVKFDLFYLAASRGTRRVLALISAIAIVAGILAALPATLDYVTFYQIKKSATLRIRLDIVFSVYAVFALAIIGRYGWRACRFARGADPDPDIPEPGAAPEP